MVIDVCRSNISRVIRLIIATVHIKPYKVVMTGLEKKFPIADPLSKSHDLLIEFEFQDGRLTAKNRKR